MRALIILIFGSLILPAWAQFNAEEFLSSSISDIELEEVRASEKFLQENNFNSPWIRELEFRAKSNDREIGLEDYRLRFGLINPFEIKANKTYEYQLEETLKLRRQVQFNDVLRQRYILLIENIYLSNQVAGIKRQLDFYLELKNVIYNHEQKDLAEEALDIQELIFNTQSELGSLLQKHQLNELLIKQRLPFNGPIAIDTGSLVTLTQISQRLNQLSDTTDLIAKLGQQENKLKQSLLKVEEAESWSNIGFIQAEYDTERGNEPAEHMGYRFGVTLPIFNSDKPDLQRDRLSLMEFQAKKKKESLENARKQQLLHMDFQFLLDQMQMVNAQREFIGHFESLEHPPNPDLVRKIWEFRWQLESKYWGLYTLLLNKYINLLHQQGRLVSLPMVNHLSRNMLPLGKDLN